MGAIYLIRHGQASFGDSDYDRLSALGIEQSRVLGESLRNRVPNVDVVVRGNMLRHRQTTEACLNAMQLATAASEDADWNEYDHEELIARFEPRYADHATLQAEITAAVDPRRAFQHMFGSAVARWVGGQHDDDYREAWPAFRARVNGALQRLLATLQPTQTALVFTSGGPISVLSAELLGMPSPKALQISWALANASVSKLVTGARGAQLSTLNEHAHLEAAPGLVTYR